MTPKKLVQNFYKSDVFLDRELTESFLHPDVLLNWHSSKGFLLMDFDKILTLTDEISRTYVRSKIKIQHILAEGNLVSVNYDHFVKTIENPREEMLLAHFIVIWEIKDGKLFRGHQMSQLS